MKLRPSLCLLISVHLLIPCAAHAQGRCQNGLERVKRIVASLLRREKSPKAIEEIVEIEVQITPDRHGESTYKTKPVDPLGARVWTRWLKQHYSTEQVGAYVEAVPYLTAVFRNEVNLLNQFEIEILPPTSGSILFGYFTLRGPKARLTDFLDFTPNVLVVEPHPSFSFGAKPPPGED